tara:strand:- start:55 stop:1101 length:1047 start_codon:yes stop_codon:yes gene_type:complete
MSDLRINNITNRTGDNGPVIAGVSIVTGTFTVPVGPTEMRGGRGRGVFGSGATPTATNVLDMIEIATTGNSTDFGDDVAKREEGYATGASSTRGVLAGGYVSPDVINTISYLTFSSGGGVSDFGDLNLKSGYQAGASDNTRMLIAGGGGDGWQRTRNIKFLTIATTGSDSSFGELIRSGAGGGTPSAEGYRYWDGFASPTRAVFAGGDVATPADTNIIQYVTIQTKGDAIQFGSLITERGSHTACSNSTRGLIAGGQTPSSNLNSIEYVTIASTGDGTDFGDLHEEIDYLGSCASATRGVFAGGQSPTKLNVIEYVTIASTGNATDFGDLTVARRFAQGCSDVHGGLG